MSRLREESTSNMRVGVLSPVANTESVLTSAGIILAASMFGLMIGSVDTRIQAGLINCCGCCWIPSSSKPSLSLPSPRS